MQHRTTWAIALTAVLAASALCTHVSHGAGLLIADNGFGGVLRTTDQTVQVTINNGIAVTKIEQTFLNTENRVVEALYTFPVPKGASVANFSMWINGKEMIGEVVEKKRAREIYESYKQKRRDPGLLEQVDYKRFEMRIFPIPAGAEQRVQIAYYQELDFDHDWATYVYPLATTSRDGAADTNSDVFSLSVDVKSEVPIVEMMSPSHGEDVAISPFDPTLYRASLEVSRANLDRDVVLAFKVKRPVTGLDTITNKSQGEDGFLQMTLTVGEELEQVEKGMDYVFVLDVSGSMRNDSKLAVSEQSVFAFLQNLSELDRFEIVTFNDLPVAHFRQLTSVTTESMNQANQLLQTLRARGGTSLRPAIETAYRYLDSDRPLNVVVLSDGMTQTDESRELMQLIQSRPAGTRVFAVGIGNEVNRPLLNDIATKSGGLAAFMSRGDDFGRQAEAFRRKLLRPAIEGVRIRFDGNVGDIEPRELGSLYHGSPLRLYARYPRGGMTNVTIEGTIMGAPFSQSATVDLADASDDNPEIERMWAWHRVGRLKSEIRSVGESPTLVNEIVQLCEGFSIVSQYASFIVLENDAEYQRWKIQRRNLLRIDRDRTAQRRVAQQLKELRERAMVKLGPTNATPSPNSAANQVVQRVLARNTNQPANRAPLAQQQPSTRRSNGSDLNLTRRRGRRSGGGGGGGALDPITASLALGLGSMGWAAMRRRRRAVGVPEDRTDEGV